MIRDATGSFTLAFRAFAFLPLACAAFVYLCGRRPEHPELRGSPLGDVALSEAGSSSVAYAPVNASGADDDD